MTNADRNTIRMIADWVKENGREDLGWLLCDIANKTPEVCIGDIITINSIVFLVTDFATEYRSDGPSRLELTGYSTNKSAKQSDAVH